MATPIIKHATLTGAAANPAVLVDGPKWDATHTITGIENVDNTSDLNKPISTATQTALDAKVTGTAAALTRVSDTNVTLTLGGTPATALLQATSITVAWTGTLAASRGGFGSDVSAAAGVPLFAAGVPTFTGTTGSGNFVRATSPTLVTPALGTPSSGILTNCTAFILTTTGTSGAAAYSAGTLNIPQYSAVVSVKKQLFNSNGTYTPSTGMVYAIVEAIGGGGGGGGGAGTVSGVYMGGGGGSGSYSRSLVTAATIGASKAVVIGAGGAGGLSTPASGQAGAATTLGSTIVVANGGSGGGFASSTIQPSAGPGGGAGTGDLAIQGASGGGGVFASVVTVLVQNGAGGNGVFGGGGQPATLSFGTAAPGNTGFSNSGGGGSGAATAQIAGNAAGGAGAAGMMLITEFCSQ